MAGVAHTSAGMRAPSARQRYRAKTGVQMKTNIAKTTSRCAQPTYVRRSERTRARSGSEYVSSWK